MKFCKHCGQQIPDDAVICTKCGRQVEEIHSSSIPSNIIINNSASASAAASASASASGNGKRAINKWTAFILCLLLGLFGAHKFYE